MPTKRVSEVLKPVFKVEHLAEDIKRAAEILEIPPHEMTRNHYRQCNPHYTENDFALCGGFGRIKSTFFPKPLNEATILRLKDLRQNQNQIAKAVGSQEIFFEELREILKHLPPLKMIPYKVTKSDKKIERYINTLISDIHIGSDQLKDETGHAYGKIEEARALAFIVRTVISYKLQYRNETALNVFLNGDLIQNLLHGPSSAAITQEQLWRAMWLIKQMIVRFAEHFKQVNIYCTTGNHDRDTSLHPKRAIAVKWASHANTIYYAVKLATEHFPNVKWEIPKTPWVDAMVLGHRIRARHSDTFLNIGNPGTTLKVNLIEQKINKINASLDDADEIEAFLLGHTHMPVVTQLANGSFVLVNGSSQPPDAFVNSMDVLETSNVQLMFETTTEHVVGDFRFIQLNQSAKDASLDSIIKPWPGLNA